MHANLVGTSGARLNCFRVDVLEELKATVTVWCLEHRNFGMVAIKAHGSVGPLTTNRVTAYDCETEVGEKGDRCFDVANGDADILKFNGHALHATESGRLAPVGRRRCRYTRWMRIRPIDLVDVLVYLVVLGVFIQLFPDVISETFLLALLTAILLKGVLEVVLWAKKKIVARIRSADTRRVRVVSAITLLLVLPGSKLMVLGLVDLVFGDAVRLGGFFQVTALIIVLMLARGGVRWVFRRTDESALA